MFVTGAKLEGMEATSFSIGSSLPGATQMVSKVALNDPRNVFSQLKQKLTFLRLTRRQ
jgi:hypothetical protein